MKNASPSGFDTTGGLGVTAMRCRDPAVSDLLAGGGEPVQRRIGEP
jgi:hypothetical protein